MLREAIDAEINTEILAGCRRHRNWYGRPAMAQERIRISSDWGDVTANLADNEAARSLAEMLPLTIEISDHLRQEKTGNLPSPLPEC